MYRTQTTSPRALFSAEGRLLALVADGPSPLAFLDVPEGGTPLTREQIAEHLATLPVEQLQGVVDAAIAEGQSIGASDDPITPEVLARIELLGDTREAAEERQQAVETEAAEAEQRRDAALARLAPPAEGGDGDGEGEGAEGAAGEGAEEGAELPQPATVASAGRRRRGGAVVAAGAAGPGAMPSSRPAAGAPAGGFTAPRAEVALVASAGLEGMGLSAGAPIESRAQLGQALNRRREALRGTRGGDGERLTVASIRTEYPEERQLGTSIDTNTDRILAATSPEVLVASAQAAQAGGALVAAGGLCAPIEQLYDVPVIGSTARPVRDALTNFGADRGGIRWREHLSFGDFAGATDVWTLADDAAVTGDPTTEPKTKACFVVECPGDMEAYVEAITLCLEFSNVSTRFDPEATAANIQAAAIAHARYAENRLLSQIAGVCTTVTGGEVLGTTRDLLTHIDRLIAGYRSFYRLDDAVALRTVFPRWVRDQIRVDMLRSMGSAYDAALLAVSDAQINAWFATRNVNVSWHLDGRGAQVAAGGAPAVAQQFFNAFVNNGTLPGFPAQIESFIWVEGDMLHLDGGTLDLGIVRDSTLNQVNRYKQFSETFEGIAHRGVEAFRLVSTVAPVGSVTGTTDPATVLAA